MISKGHSLSISVTPTKASIVAVLYALGVGTVVYRSLGLRALLMVLVGFTSLFSWILARE